MARVRCDRGPLRVRGHRLATKALPVLPDWGPWKESRPVFPKVVLWDTSPVESSAKKEPVMI